VSESNEHVFAEVAYGSILGLMHPMNGSTHGEDTRRLTMFPSKGRFYLAGVRTFVMGDYEDLRITILHPRTEKPLLASRVADLDHDHRPVLHQFFGDMFVPLWGHRNDPADIEPAYCSEDLPLVLEVEGRSILHLNILGDDHYTVRRSRGPSCMPESLGEFRGPYGAAGSGENADPAQIADLFERDSEYEEMTGSTHETELEDPARERESRPHIPDADAVMILVRAVRDLCATEVSGNRYDDDDRDAGDDVRSLDPQKLLDQIAEQGHAKHEGSDP